MVKPILVVGRNRSGTKWLSNSIANHPDVACVQRPGAGGILETNLLSYMPRLFGNLSIDENYYGFITCFAQTNFFKLTGLDKRVLFTYRINSYYRFFEYIMELYAQKEGKEYWLQKTNSLQLERLLSEFPDAKFIIIQRNIKDNIRSTVGLRKLTGNSHPVGGVIRDIMGYYLFHKVESCFQNRDNVFATKYELLKETREQTLKQISDFIGIQFNPGMLVDIYKKNTSFKKGVSKKDVLNKRELFTIELLSPVLKQLPWYVYNIIWKTARRIRGTRPDDKRFISLTFSLLAQELELRENVSGRADY